MMEMRLFIFAIPIATLIVSVAPPPPESPELGYALANSNFINYSGPPPPIDNKIDLDILSDNGLKIKPRLDPDTQVPPELSVESVSINEFLSQRGLQQEESDIPSDNIADEFLVASLPKSESLEASEFSPTEANSPDVERIIKRQALPAEDNINSNMMVADFDKVDKATLHIVGEGETAFSLARRFCSTPQDIRLRNDLDDSFAIEKGQVLTIPKTTC